MTNDAESYILAKVYNFLPDQIKGGRGPRAVEAGKYEPDNNAGESSRTIVLASFTGRCNLLIKYNPSDLHF